jgi:NitT/TauT family transport system permease protein
MNTNTRATSVTVPPPDVATPPLEPVVARPDGASPGDDRSVRRRTLRRLVGLLPSTALVVLCLVIWEVWVRVGDVPSYLLVPPSEVAALIWTEWGSFAPDVRSTVTEAFLGLLFGTAFGVVLAVAIVHSQPISRAIFPLIIGSQVVPKVAIAPLLILWLGAGTMPKIVVAMLMAFFPVVMNHAFGLRSVPDDMIDLGRSLKASTFKIFYRIRFPYSLPALFTGIKLASALAIIGAVVGEFIAASSGLGYRIVFANQNLDSKTMLASVVLLVGVGIVFFACIAALERLVAPWAKTSQTTTGGMTA